MAKIKKCIIVTGMHRSGTSLTSGIISKMGFDTGKIAKGDASNKTGYFENLDVMNNNQDLLVYLNTNWTSDKPLPKDWRKKTGQYYKNLKNILSNFNTNNVVIKDPRICRLFPMFKDAMAELNIDMKVVLSFRNPYDVAGSLMARNTIDEASALKLWNAYYDDILNTASGVDRSIVFYDDLLDRSKEAFEALRIFVGGNKMSGELVKNKLRHNKTNKYPSGKTKEIYDYLLANKHI